MAAEIVESIPIVGQFSRFDDRRGSWSRTFQMGLFRELGLGVAENSVSFTQSALTLRGLHSMDESAGEWKLISCARGEIWDVAVNVRRGSPNFGSYETFSLRGDRADWVLIPPGYAHGFISLTDEVVLSYTMSIPFDPALEVGFRYDDPRFGIQWPGLPAVVSEKDLSFSFIE